MPPLKPEDPDIMITEALNAGDLDAAVALYEPEAVLLTGPEEGAAARGTDAIRRFFNDFIAMQPKAKTQVNMTIQVGDIALTGCNWVFEATGPDGSPISTSGRSIEVVRRQPDGTWPFVIDNPYPQCPES